MARRCSPNWSPPTTGYRSNLPSLIPSTTNSTCSTLTRSTGCPSSASSGPGQKTPVHDHLTWGLVGGLRGRERETTYEKQADGSYKATGSALLLPGQTTAVSPAIGDVHEVANDLADQPSISIHVYGRNIGRVHRHVFDPSSGAEKSFVSGYASDVVPNLWS